MPVDISILYHHSWYYFCFFIFEDVQFSYMSAHSRCRSFASCWPQKHQHKKPGFVVF